MSIARYLSKLGALLTSDGKITAAGIADGAIGTDQLANSGVTAGTYGSASAIPAITVDAKGRVTGVSTNSFSNAYAGYGTQLFTASGTFTVPAGVTSVKVTCIAGGGGGMAYTYGSFNGGNAGGRGGIAVGTVTVTPGAAYTVTVGAGGAARLTAGTATAGGTSSFGALMSATGGTGASGSVGNTTVGNFGAGSGGNIYNSVASSPLAGGGGLDASMNVPTIGGDYQRSAGQSSSTAAAAYSVSGFYCPGARGTGNGSSCIGFWAVGAVGGAVLVEW